MSASFGVVGRAQLAGYAGTAGGILRRRIHPLVPVAAIDVLAVAVALGAMNLVGTIVGGHRENPFLAAIDRSKDDFTTFAVKSRPSVATPAANRQGRAARGALAAVPDAELLFGQPVLIGTAFETGQGDTVRFVSPVDVAANNAPATRANGPTAGEEPPPTDVAVIDAPTLPVPAADDPPSPLAAKILGIAGRTKARVVDIADEAVVAPVAKVVDAAVPLKGNSGPSAGSTTTTSIDRVGGAVTSITAPMVQAAAAPVQAVAAPVQSVAAPVVQATGAPVQQVVQTVTQPVAQVASGVTGLLK